VALVRSINRTGVTVILIEHVLEAVMAVSARIIVLDRGRKIADGTPSVVVRDKAVIEAYLGSALADA
jgi:ABC-type branched-subunit amino acid transport system ATPase component